MSSETIPEWAEKAAQDFHDKWETGMSGAAFRDLVRALLAAEQRGLEKAAEVADAYSEVNWEQCTDSILLDPVLSNRGARALTKDDWARSESMSIDGTIHSSMYHAATNIAAAIRSLGEKT